MDFEMRVKKYLIGSKIPWKTGSLLNTDRYDEPCVPVVKSTAVARERTSSEVQK